MASHSYLASMLFDQIANDPEVQAYKPEILSNGLDFDKLVQNGIMHATEGIHDANTKQIARTVALYLAHEIKACGLRKIAQSKGTTFLGKLWRNTIGRLLR